MRPRCHSVSRITLKCSDKKCWLDWRRARCHEVIANSTDLPGLSSSSVACKGGEKSVSSQDCKEGFSTGSSSREFLPMPERVIGVSESEWELEWARCSSEGVVRAIFKAIGGWAVAKVPNNAKWGHALHYWHRQRIEMLHTAWHRCEDNASFVRECATISTNMDGTARTSIDTSAS